jgi:hypothetical protein
MEMTEPYSPPSAASYADRTNLRGVLTIECGYFNSG